MGLSTAQKFLVEANRSTGTGEYFRWRTVGTTLGYSEEESHRAVRSLDERKLLILLNDGNARMLVSGRQLAARLLAKPSGEAVKRGAGRQARRG